MTLKIAFGYKMGSGKDSCAEYLKSTLGGASVSFASPLYDILHFAQNTCGFPIAKDRAFLQWVGTEWGQSIDPDVWVKILLKKTKELCKDHDYIYCTDLRFLQEFRALKEDGWYCVKVTKPFLATERTGSGSITHRSETELDYVPDCEWDAVLDNNGTIVDLYEKLDLMVDIFKYSEEDL